MVRFLFRGLLALLPTGFRQEWMGSAARDLDVILEDLRSRRGPAAAAWAGLSACWDVTRAIPLEWWKVFRSHFKGNPRRERSGFGEKMMNWMKEFRLAGRTLARRPGYAATAMTTLALGIGATVAIFTVVNAVLLRPLPYPDSDALVAINHHAPALNLPDLNNSAGTLNFYWQEADFLQAMAGYDTQQRNLLGGPQPERVEILAASPQIFQVLRVQPALGRPFNEADAAEGAPSVLLLTHGSWITRFGADPSILGKTLEVDGVLTEVVGVLPEGFAFPDPDPVAMVPLFVDPDGSFGQFGTSAIARLNPGLSAQDAQARAEQLQSRLVDFFPDLDQDFLDQAGWGVSVERFQDFLVGDEVASALWVVLGTVAFVFLIACANVANLFLVRAESRQKEMALRSAMGAGFSRIAEDFLFEALILGVGGGLMGLGLAWLGVDLLVAHGPQELPRLGEVSVDGATLGFAAILALGSTLLFGTVPLLKFAGGGLAGLLRDGGRANTDGAERHRTRNVLVAAQLALALVLLVGSGLMFRSFQQLQSVDPGVNPENVLTVGVSLGESIPNPEAASFYQQVADQVAALPGVTSVGLSTFVPIGGGGANGGSFYIESEPRDEETLPPVAMYKAIGGDYLTSMEQQLIRGRNLTRADWEGGGPVLLVNKSFEDRYLGGDAIGEMIKWDEDQAFARVVGVVEDAREINLRDEPGPWAYLPMVVGEWPYPQMDRSFLLIRAVPGIPISVPAIRSIIEGLNPTVPLTSIRTMDEVMAQEMSGLSFTLVLLGIAAGVALFLGAIGLFGVISYVVSQSTREIGVRVALGADGPNIRSMVLRQGAKVAVVGVVLGLLGAAALTRLLGAILYGVSALDPFSFIVAPGLLLVVMVTATWLPARRAAQVDPMEALRSE